MEKVLSELSRVVSEIDKKEYQNWSPKKRVAWCGKSLKILKKTKIQINVHMDSLKAAKVQIGKIDRILRGIINNDLGIKKTFLSRIQDWLLGK